MRHFLQSLGLLFGRIFHRLAPWLGLALLFVCFADASAVFGEKSLLSLLDFRALAGSFGCIETSEGVRICDVVPKGGAGAKAGFLYCLSLVPSIMLTCGILGVLRFWRTDLAAQKLFSPLVRALCGLPGTAALAMMASLQSSDAGALETKELFARGKLTQKQRDVLAMWQFSSSGTLINVFSNGLAVLPFLVTPVGEILLVIIGAKFLGANLMRLYLQLDKGRAQGGLS